MFRAVPASRQTAGDSDDDTISLTSTAPDEHDPEQEFVVKDILAVHEAGHHYLIEWEGFPLHEANWEPISELDDGLTSMWEQRKENEASGKVEPFDVVAWEAMVARVRAAKQERHFRRNRKRKKRGLPETEPILATRTPSNPAILEEITASTGLGAESSGSDSEAEVVDERPAEPTDKPRHQAPADKKKGKATATLPPLRTPATARAPAATQAGPSGTDSQRAGTSKKPAGGDVQTVCVSGKTVSKPLSPPPRRAPAKAPATTGYQGTARKIPTKPTPARNAVGPSTAASLPGPSKPPPKTAAASKSEASGKGPLTAKRTTAAAKTGNIFTSGKVQKTNPQFKDVLADPSQPPKKFRNHRIRNIAQKATHQERPPNPEDLHLFSLDKVPARKGPLSPTSPSTQVAGSLHQMQLEPAPRPAAPSLPAPQASVLDSGRDSGQTASPVPLPAKPALKPVLKKTRASTGPAQAKKVVFADEHKDRGELFISTTITGSPEPMDYEPAPERPAGRVLRSPPPSETKPTWKKITLGRNAAIDVLFAGLPAISNHRSIPWRDAFFCPGLETLRVRHVCLAHNVKMKLPNLVFGNLNQATGTLEAKDGNGSSLEAVAKSLASGFLGLCYPHPKFTLLIYPAKCELWKEAMAGREGPSDPDAVLRFWICDAAFDFTAIMRPWGCETAQSPPQSTELPNTYNQETVSMMQRWFKFNYKKLLPVRSAASPGPVSFFLAFPGSKLAHLIALSSWLLANNPGCRIFVGLRRGSWMAFTSTLEEDKSAGVVIVHESLVGTLRRFPSLRESLKKMNDQYWCFSDPDRPQPAFPSMRVVENPRGPATPEFIRLFPDRAAILLTPSFLVSQPRATQRLLTWFYKSRAGNVSTRLVTGWDLHQYLCDLAKQMANERQEIKASQYDSELELQSRGLSHEECNDRFISSVRAMELHNRREYLSGLYDAEEEDNSPLIYAPADIDPNDEQSLVNWFGWWSLQRADQYRQFFIMGTDDPRSRSRRFERRIRIPTYTRVTINDPDVVLQTIQQYRSDVAAQLPDPAAVNPPSWNAVMRAGTGPGNYLSPRTNELHSDGAHELHKALEAIRRQHLRAGGPITLFHHPVSYDDADMSYYFSDPMEDYNRIITWWRFTHPFVQRHGCFNTYIGFFYAIEEEWDPKAIPPGPRPKRHPWIVAYRPVNAHQPPFSRCEVIIWDTCAPAKYPNRRSINENELSYMQRRVIQVVREGTEEKNPGTMLYQVWLGGFSPFPGDDKPYPIDRTLHWLDSALEDFRKYLPAPEYLMSGRGFIPVMPDKNAPVPRPLLTANGLQGLGDDPMQLDSSGSEAEDDDEDARMIFHPPRGNKLPPGQRTKCTNKLYEAARLAKARNERDTTMVYQFPSTTTWYREQEAEGRDFQHITLETNFDEFLALFDPKWKDTPTSSKAGPRVSD